MNLDYTERPKVLDDIVGHDNIKKDMKSYIKTGDPPHLLFIGPPGIGKNCMAYCFASEYLGREISLNTEDGDRDYKEYNCSLITSIESVRNEMSDYLKTKGHTIRDLKRLKKILFLNECEELSDAAKKSLRSEIEKYEKNVIVIFATNYAEKVGEEALISRVAAFEFKRPPIEEICKWFDKTADKYNVVFDDSELIIKIVEYYKGDMRAMLVDCLEALRGYPLTNIDYEDGFGRQAILITKKDLYKIFGDDTRSYAKQVFDSDNPKEKWKSLWMTEYFDNRKFLLDYMELMNGKYSRLFAKIDSRLRRGSNPIIQMSCLFDVIKNG